LYVWLGDLKNAAKLKDVCAALEIKTTSSQSHVVPWRKKRKRFYKHVCLLGSKTRPTKFHVLSEGEMNGQGVNDMCAFLGTKTKDRRGDACA